MKNYFKLIIASLLFTSFITTTFADGVQSATGAVLITNNVKGSYVYSSESNAPIPYSPSSGYFESFQGVTSLEKNISIYADESRNNKICDVNINFIDNQFAGVYPNQNFDSFCLTESSGTINCKMSLYFDNTITFKNQSSKVYCAPSSGRVYNDVIDIGSFLPTGYAPGRNAFFQVGLFLNVNSK